MPANCTNGFVGYVGNSSNKNLKIMIEIEYQWMIEHNFITIALCIDRDDYNKATIVMSPRYFDMFRKTPFLLFYL